MAPPSILKIFARKRQCLRRNCRLYRKGVLVAVEITSFFAFWERLLIPNPLSELYPFAFILYPYVNVLSGNRKKVAPADV